MEAQEDHQSITLPKGKNINSSLRFLWSDWLDTARNPTATGGQRGAVDVYS